MAASDDDSFAPPKPGWASSLGAIAIVLGVLCAAFHGNEWLKQTVLAEHGLSAATASAECPQEELEEERLTLAECEYLVAHVAGLAASTPAWFPRAMTWLAVAGFLFAFGSIIVGGALVNYSPAASSPAIAILAALALVDALQFAVAVNAGPILRAAYLWPLLLWFIIHMMMTLGAVAGCHAERRV